MLALHGATHHYYALRLVSASNCSYALRNPAVCLYFLKCPSTTYRLPRIRRPSPLLEETQISLVINERSHQAAILARPSDLNIVKVFA